MPQMGWSKIAEPGRPCQAPKHSRRARPRAKWRIVVVAEGVPNEFQDMCGDCMAQVAADLGTTPEAGQLAL